MRRNKQGQISLCGTESINACFCTRVQRKGCHEHHVICLFDWFLSLTGFLLGNYRAPWSNFVVVIACCIVSYGSTLFLLAVSPYAFPAPAVRMVPPSGRCQSGWSPLKWVSTVRTSAARGLSPWTRSCRWRMSKSKRDLRFQHTTSYVTGWHRFLTDFP